MQRHGQPELMLLIWGDWYTVISARDYRDDLIDQKPDDEETANYWRYRLPCKTTADLVKAYHVFHDTHKCQCAFAMYYKSPEGVASFWTETETGYHDDKPSCEMEMRIDGGKLHGAVEKAIDILSQAIE